MGESLCISSKKPNVKIIRPSNVTGKLCPPNLFIPSIIQDAIKNNKIILRSSLDSEKDFIHVDDLVRIIPKIIHEGKSNIYNIASGKNTTTRDLINEISKLTNCDIEVVSNVQPYSSPVISIDRLKAEFNFVPEPIIPRISEIVEHYRKLEST
jgi:nucleoside-diphosphate-sugar epimerase